MSEPAALHRRVLRLALVLACCAGMSALSAPRPVGADPGTVTPTETPGVTPEPTARPTSTVPPSPIPSPVIVVRPTAIRPTAIRPTSAPEPTRAKKRHKYRHRSPTATPTSTATHYGQTHKHKKAKHKPTNKRPHRKATATPTPTRTATPALNVHADDSITPVTCNGPAKSAASAPFLTPPYRGWISVVSYFDHDLPNFSRDGVEQIATGLSAEPDQLHTRSDFPAYWNTGLRQYVYYDGHNGYDYNLWYQPVYTVAPGKVIFSAFEYPSLPDHGYGKMVMIDHGNGYVTLYGHLGRILVHNGQRVKRGQQIGVSGNTGHSSGPHLHFTVFHNCTPTDPYGWTGSGPDPLTDYQGESSIYLWRQPPLIANPLPSWPGAARFPASSVTRIALLRLPTTARGTGAFTRALRREAKVAAAQLRARGLFVNIDPLRAALIVTGTTTAGTLFAAKGVVSLTTSDTEEGDRDDVLHALALAAQVTKHARLNIGRSSRWTGYLLRWQQRTFLVGTGVKGGDVDLQLNNGVKQSAVHRLHADPKTGAFAVDLGRMTPKQRVALSRELEGKGTGGSSLVPRAPVRHQPVMHQERTQGRTRTPLLVTALLLACVGVSAVFLGPRWRRRRGSA